LIDDKADFIASAKESLKSIEKLSTLATGSKKEALEHIIKTNPEAVLLDMHLTSGEEFD
jgi:CheY-like chemotaxis protein